MTWFDAGRGLYIKRDDDGNIVRARYPALNAGNLESKIRELCAPHAIEFDYRPDYAEGIYEVCVHRVFEWTVKLRVSPTWVADGFNLDNDRAHRMLAEHLPYAYNCELEAVVLTAPDPKSIRKEQGCRDDS